MPVEKVNIGAGNLALIDDRNEEVWGEVKATGRFFIDQVPGLMMDKYPEIGDLVKIDKINVMRAKQADLSTIYLHVLDLDVWKKKIKKDQN